MVRFYNSYAVDNPQIFKRFTKHHIIANMPSTITCNLTSWNDYVPAIGFIMDDCDLVCMMKSVRTLWLWIRGQVDDEITPIDKNRLLPTHINESSENESKLTVSMAATLLQLHRLRKPKSHWNITAQFIISEKIRIRHFLFVSLLRWSRIRCWLALTN